MINIFNSIVNTVVSLLGFIIHSVQSLLALIINIPTYISWLISSISFMPVLVMPFILSSLALLVILFVVNRGH